MKHTSDVWVGGMYVYKAFAFIYIYLILFVVEQSFIEMNPLSSELVKDLIILPIYYIIYM